MSCRTLHNYRKLNNITEFFNIVMSKTICRDHKLKNSLKESQFHKSKASTESLVGENSTCYRKLRASNNDYMLSKLRAIDKSSIM